MPSTKAFQGLKRAFTKAISMKMPINLFDERGRLKRKPIDRFEPSFLRLARSIPAGYHHLFRGVSVGHSLGFSGLRQFHTLSQAIAWVESGPGDSWAYKRHVKVSLDDLLACTSSTIPEHILVIIRRTVPA